MSTVLEGSRAVAVPDLSRPQSRRILLCVVFAAFLLRFAGCFDGGLPWTFYKDEENNIERSLRFAAEGSLDPHWFNKPALGYYIWLGEFGAYYAVGRALGRFTGPEDFAVQWFSNQEPLLLIARTSSALFGCAGVWLTYLLARRLLSRRASLAAAAALAVTVGQLSGSQEVKKDVLAATLAIASMLSMFDLMRRGCMRDSVRCGIWAGLSMAVKYYALALFVPFLYAHLFRRQGITAGASRPVRGLLAGMAAFVAAFFVGSPYNFLSAQFWNDRILPQFRFLLARLHLGQLGQAPVDSHAGVVDPTTHSLLDSALYAVGRLCSVQGMGPVLITLAATGMLAAFLRSRGLRGEGRTGFMLLLVICLSMGTAAAFANTQFSEPRHLNSLYPPLCVLAAAGAATLASRWRSRSGDQARRQPGALAVMGICLLIPLPWFPGWEVVDHTLTRWETDPRIAALLWIEQNVPEYSVILSDRDWVPLHPDEARCQKMLDQIGRLMEDAARHRQSAEAEADQVVRARHLEQALASEAACKGYRQRWELLLRGARAAERPAWDVITLDQDWQTEDLNARLRASSGYNPLNPRSPYGHLMRELLTEASTRQNGVDAAWIRRRFDERYSDLLRQSVTRTVAAMRPLPEDVQGTIDARVAEARQRLGLDEAAPKLTLLWTSSTPVSARWLTTEQRNGRAVPRPVQWLVTSQHNFEAYGNNMAAHKAANFPEWAAFYADVLNHYHCVEFGTGSADNRRVVRVYDLRTRTDQPEVRRL